ncbi:4-hydroxybenzoate polyprenyltransferase [Helicobacter sp. MIT 21-1697]|uniref:menaquinone biosynthesis prenyltransferase MqnP n=1 Tax=Helicobacter sp. MIT 21-1697 TaxID=2993733 RepID=UPI00224A8693|nr:menaquinone biosynthesis prenyltransferase MqnP [Helicobacter sp. MIT 21-1697]MCX2716780.1 4-hydroxybenzoate polyprenyltransferase [Helicobacter sp. MIT 21-1697]
MNLFQALGKQIKNFSDLVAFEHTIFSSSFILIAMVVASMQMYGIPWCGWETFILCIFALVSARNFAMGFNRLKDRDIDALNFRTNKRPSVDGRISLSGLVAFNVINALIFICVSYCINTLAFYLCAPFLVILAFYSYTKRFSAIAHWVLGVCLGLAPIAGVIAVMGEIPLWSIFLSVGVLFWVAGFDLLYSIQDIEFDKDNHLHSIPAYFGVKATLWISRLCHILAIGFWASFVYEAQLGKIAELGVVLSALMLCYEQYLVSVHLKNIPKAFFVTNGYLGMIFFICILIDSIKAVYGY